MHKLLKLNDGLTIPQLGYGTYLIDDKIVQELVVSALKAGYHHIDTAAFYGNEAGIGRALSESGKSREDYFLTTKVWIDDFGNEPTVASVKASLEKLQTDYLDLVLIHWPKPGYLESWDALAGMRKDGFIRSIGVSNFSLRFLKELEAHSDIVPVVNQIECHPLLPQNEMVDYCRAKSIVVESWAPIAQGKVNGMPELKQIGEAYGKSEVQVTLRWHLQRGLVAIPKTSRTMRLAENLDVFDFELSPAEMDVIKNLDTGTLLGFDPDVVYDRGFVRID